MRAAVNAHRLGNYGRAEDQLRKALEVAETFATEDPRLAETLNGLGLVYFEQDRFEAAEPLLKRALRIDERTIGAADP